MMPAGYQPHTRRNPLIDPLEPLFARETPGAVCLAVDIRNARCNARGFAHGGLISSLAENAMGPSAVRRARRRQGAANATAVTILPREGRSTILTTWPKHPLASDWMPVGYGRRQRGREHVRLKTCQTLMPLTAAASVSRGSWLMASRSLVMIASPTLLRISKPYPPTSLDLIRHRHAAAWMYQSTEIWGLFDIATRTDRECHGRAWPGSCVTPVKGSRRDAALRFSCRF
jgi:hypothetical protein